MKTSRLDRNDPRRNEYLGLVRRRVAAGSFTKADVEKWKADLGDVVVDIVQEAGANAAAAKKAGAKAGAKAAAEKKAAANEADSS